MRTFLILLLAIMGFSCKTNYYLSDPIKSIPNINQQAGLKSNGMLLASDAHLQVDTAYFEKCLNSVRLYLEKNAGIKIKEEICFHQSPDTSVLAELKTSYKAVGLLLLTDLYFSKNGFEVPSGKSEYSGREHESYLVNTGRSINYTNVNVDVTSRWEYHDFTTGRSYQFKIATRDVLELGEHVQNLEAYIEKDPELLDPAFYQNGTFTAVKLMLGSK